MPALASERIDVNTVSPSQRRGLGLSLLVIATAQLMLVLDDTIANIALPSIQRDLGVDPATLPWIVNAYVLAFGSLLLFGGRVGDLYGRRRVFRLGLGVFTLASLLGGFGTSAAMLVGSRALQGLGAALTAPNALALIATTFPMGAARNKAMAVYGAMSALGITIGVLLGGLLTGLLSWRWVFFINVPIGLAVLIGARVLVEGRRNAGRLDTLSAITGTGGMFALAYGITRGGEHGWGDATTLGLFFGALALSAIFVVQQARQDQPMLPLGLFGDRNRSGSYATMLFTGAGLMGTFYLMTLFLQEVLQFSPVRTGLASLPFSVGIILGAGISSKLVERLAPRFVAGPGLVFAAAGMLLLSTISPAASYALHILPGVFLTSFGLGVAAVTMTLTAVHGIADERAGVASSLVNMAQQIGAALGLAVFTTIALAAAARESRGELPVQEGLVRSPEALAHGYATAFLSGAGMLLLAALIVVFAVNTRHTQKAGAGAAR
jgi:EmrB/QacA subfamily drug resistance transporter